MERTALCYGCDTAPTEGQWSEEHIFPNALGGRWRSNKILCTPCNNTLGAKIDAALCKELGLYMHLLKLDRERGDVPNQEVTLDGEPYLRDRAGNLRRAFAKVERTVSDGERIDISINAGRMKGARRALEGIARKHPGKVNVEELLALADVSTTPFNGEIIYKIGGIGSDEALRAIAKIGASAFVTFAGNSSAIKDLVAYIKGARATPEPVRWFLHTDPFAGRDTRSVTHAVALRGDPQRRQLWAYVELFTAFRFAVRLGDQYAGPSMASDYVFDLFSRTELRVFSPLQFEPWDLDLDDGGLDAGLIESWLQKLATRAVKREREWLIESAVQRAWDKAASESATGERLAELILSEVMPLLTAWMEERRRREPTPQR